MPSREPKAPAASAAGWASRPVESQLAGGGEMHELMQTEKKTTQTEFPWNVVLVHSTATTGAAQLYCVGVSNSCHRAATRRGRAVCGQWKRLPRILACGGRCCRVTPRAVHPAPRTTALARLSVRPRGCTGRRYLCDAGAAERRSPARNAERWVFASSSLPRRDQRRSRIRRQCVAIHRTRRAGFNAGGGVGAAGPGAAPHGRVRLRIPLTSGLTRPSWRTSRSCGRTGRACTRRGCQDGLGTRSLRLVGRPLLGEAGRGVRLRLGGDAAFASTSSSSALNAAAVAARVSQAGLPACTNGRVASSGRWVHAAPVDPTAEA